MFEMEKLERERQRIESQCQLPCVDNTHVTRLCSYGHDLNGVFFVLFFFQRHARRHTKPIVGPWLACSQQSLAQREPAFIQRVMHCNPTQGDHTGMLHSREC